MIPGKYECFMSVEYTETCGCQKGCQEGAVADVPGDFAPITVLAMTAQINIRIILKRNKLSCV